MFHILCLIGIISAAHLTIDRGTPSFTLDAKLVNPRVTEYKANSQPFTLYWKIHQTPYMLSKSQPNISLSVTSEVNQIDSSLFVTGDYIFVLYTSNLKDAVIETHFYNVSVHEAAKYVEFHSFVNYLSIIDVFMIWLYKTLTICTEMGRTLLVYQQYHRDNLGFKYDISSPSYVAYWRMMNIDISHYENLVSLPGGRFRLKEVYTLRDYFKRNNALFYDETVAIINTMREITGLEFKI